MRTDNGDDFYHALAKEDSVRGVLVRAVERRCETADEEEQRLLKDALKLLLSRFEKGKRA
jgi:hypothetical protein